MTRQSASLGRHRHRTVALLCLATLAAASLCAARADRLPPGIQVIHVHTPPYLDRPPGAGPYSDADIADATELAKLGDAEAEANLGIMLQSRGKYRQAAFWYKQAANAGIGNAAYNLGTLYFNGEGFQKDYAKAYQWFRRAAERDNPYAEFQLGLMHYTGQGVSKDPAQELKWYLRAARHGLAAAQYNLAVMHHDGQGVPKDDVQAYAWMLLAEKGGLAAASDALTILAQNLTSQQIEAAQALSRKLDPALSAPGR